ncbi:MmgE/PrpD family protein [Sphingomonas sp. QA11]|uniref:MmgE/PrpD family protein n=1 Tax=Sphingomonas sp. QA11 TaxID=2950605 RepID=UPI00234A0CBC|nr:MmgE/PrpD family protein [Sphingomonas sp. QA11]WCM25859.1 MmgE/PrpD family protein [Sphingomonas sp. QA11]
MAEATQDVTDPAGVTGQLCTWLTDLTLAVVPAETIERAKDLILDGLGCAIVGAQLPWSRVAVEAVLDLEGTGEAPIIGWDRTTTAPAAALLNGTFIQGFELDDFHPLGPLHSASVVLPALFALASRQKISGADFLLASIAGFEVGPRVGMALRGPQMLSRGWHSGAVFGTHAAAVAVGKVLGFSPGTYEDALGLAGTQSAGLMAAQYEAMCKRMHHGFSAKSGYYAAMLAKGGYTGIKRVFERDYGGFLAVFGEGHEPLPEKISEGLGEQWETHRIVLKPYAAMGALHAPLDAVFKIAERRPWKADDIEHIEIGMSHAAYHHGWWEVERPLTPIGAQMNVGYAVAAAILDGAAMVHQFSPTRIDADDVWSLIPKIRAHHNPDMDGFGRTGNITMVVSYTDGTEATQHIGMPRTVADPLKRDEVLAKFATLTEGIIDNDRRDAIVRAVLGLDTLSDVGDLVALLAPTVGSPFEVHAGQEATHVQVG